MIVQNTRYIILSYNKKCTGLAGAFSIFRGHITGFLEVYRAFQGGDQNLSASQLSHKNHQDQKGDPYDFFPQARDLEENCLTVKSGLESDSLAPSPKKRY